MRLLGEESCDQAEDGRINGAALAAKPFLRNCRRELAAEEDVEGLFMTKSSAIPRSEASYNANGLETSSLSYGAAGATE